MSTITWTPDDSEALAAVRGVTFEGGRPDTVNGVRVVKFERPLINGKRMCAKIDGRPALAQAVDEYDAQIKADNAAREAKWAEERRKQAEADAPLIASMEEDERRLIAQIPDGAIRVTVKQTGDCDGDPILHYEADGTEIAWDKVEYVGTASAIRPGALGEFDCRRVAYVTRQTLDKVRAERDAQIEADKADKDADQAFRDEAFRLARETGEPQEIDRWTETRRAKDGGEWGDYLFVCRRLAMPDGTTKETATNTY